jgi:hypothetical protein
MENYPLVISGEKVNEEDLLKFVVDTRRITGVEITVTPQWVVACADPTVATALYMLFGPQPVAEVKLTPRGRAKLKAPKAELELKQAEPKEIRIWEVHVPGISGKTLELPEKLTITERNLRLAEGKFAPGTLLRHPKAGWQKVTGVGPGQGLNPMEAAEAIALLDA